MYDVAVIGGGAAGLCAAIAASREGAKTVLLEKLDRVGKKLLSTGNGRCNLSNRDLSLAHYRGEKVFLQTVLEDSQEIERFFSGLGLLMREENGRIYPLSNHANSVLDCLRIGAERAGVFVETGQTVQRIIPLQQGFCLEGSLPIQAARVVVATGGCAAPKLGSDGSGFALLRGVGHRVTSLTPALVQLCCCKEEMRGLKGVRAYAEATLWQGENLLYREYGEIQFTEYGLSGIPMFNVSSRVARATLPLRITLNFLVNQPPLDPNLPLTGAFHRPLADYLTRRGVSGDNVSFTVIGTRGWDQAQVTAGGAVLEEFDAATLESRMVSGLYACGEVLDVDGDCGGYNLHWAWASGLRAGRSAAQSK